MGFFGTLTLIFIVLKLVGVITWSWWVVLLFVWLPIAFIFGVLMTAGLINKK